MECTNRGVTKIVTKMLREDLGDYCSVACFKAVIEGMEEALGDKVINIALATSGRSRGKKVAQELGLDNPSISLDLFADKLGFTLGKNGTCLCITDKITQEDGLFKVYVSETLCSAGEPQGSNRKCSFTMGVYWGALEVFTGKNLQGKQIESVLQGGGNDTFEFQILDKNI
jgi:hypothetical protein